MTVVSNSSPLISLAAVQQLELLKQLFEEIIIPTAVYDEVVVQGQNKPGANDVERAEWIISKAVRNRKDLESLRKDYHLGHGESETIVLVYELQADWIILDELPARKAANDHGQRLIGTIGILLLAKDLGLIHSVREILDLLIQHGFRVAEKGYHEAVSRAGEVAD